MRRVIVVAVVLAACGDRAALEQRDREIERLRAENAKLKTQAKPAPPPPVETAPEDRVMAAIAPGYVSAVIRGDLAHAALDTDGDVRECVATFQAIGRGRRPEIVLRLGGVVLDDLVRGGEQTRLNLGTDRAAFYDEHGSIRFTRTNVAALRRFYLKRAGSPEAARRLASFENNLGPEVAASLFAPDAEAALRP